MIVQNAPGVAAGRATPSPEQPRRGKGNTSPVRFGLDTGRFGLPSTEFTVARPGQEPLHFRHWYAPAAGIPAASLAGATPPGKPVMLIIHGLGSQSAMLTPYVQDMLARHPDMAFVGLDLPEIFGDPERKSRYSRRTLEKIDDAIRLLAEQSGSPIVVTGVSLGGLLSTRAVARNKAHVAGLVLVSPAFAPSKMGLLKRLWKLTGWSFLETPEPPASRPDYRARLTPGQQAIWEVKDARQGGPGMDFPGALRILGTMLRAKSLDAALLNPPLPGSLRERLGLRRVPVLGFAVQNDEMVSTRAIQNFMRRLRMKKSLQVFPDSAHNLCHDPRLPEMAGRISRWLNGLRASM